MGKELSTQDSLNSSELSNNKSNIYFWLHQVIDGVKLTKFATFENLVNAGYALLQNAFTWDNIQNKPDTYPPEAHEHPEYEGGSADARIKMWVGAGATSSNPHIVFDTAFNKAGFMLLRFPFSTYRFTVWGPKPNDPNNCYSQDTSTGGATVSYSDRLSSSGIGVFGAWDSANSMYVCFLI